MINSSFKYLFFFTFGNFVEKIASLYEIYEINNRILILKFLTVVFLWYLSFSDYVFESGHFSYLIGLIALSMFRVFSFHKIRTSTSKKNWIQNTNTFDAAIYPIFALLVILIYNSSKLGAGFKVLIGAINLTHFALLYLYDTQPSMPRIDAIFICYFIDFAIDYTCVSLWDLKLPSALVIQLVQIMCLGLFYEKKSLVNDTQDKKYLFSLLYFLANGAIIWIQQYKFLSLSMLVCALLSQILFFWCNFFLFRLKGFKDLV